jgi:competence protein ComEC
MPFSVLSFFFGVLFLQQWVSLPNTFILVLAIILAIPCWYFSYRRISYFIFGFIWASLFAVYYSNQILLHDLQGKELLVQGEIIGLTQTNKRRVRFDFKVMKSDVSLPDKLRLSWYYPKKELKPGQQWKFWLKLKKPHGTLNPAAFDYEKWLFSKNIGATGYIRRPETAQLLSEKTHKQSITVLRYELLKLLDGVSASKESMALIKALTLGDKSNISSAQWRVMTKSGTNHLMAISGLHIGLIAAMVYALVFALWVRLPEGLYSAPQIAASSSWFAALFYATLAGFSIPTQRALIMLSLLLLTILLKRQSRPINVLSIALLLVLCFDPLSVLSTGFYLSFLAVFLILYVFSARLGLENSWKGAIKLHFLMGIALLPVLFFFFQTGSIIAPIANIIAVPVVSFILLPLSLLALVLLILTPEIAKFLFILVDQIFYYLWQFLSYLTELSFSSLVLPQPNIWQLVIAMLGLLLILAPRGIPAKYLGIILILPLFFVKIDRPEQGNIWFTLLDVGQGLSVVVETESHRLVFDTGARFSTEMDMGISTVLPFLHYRQIKVLDMLIISHADNDHIGGAKSILKEITTDKILSSVPEELSDYHAQLCRAGQKWVWDAVEFIMLSPTELLFTSENNNSCVLQIKTKYGSVLLTGDIEKQAESRLVQKYSDRLVSKILIAPHHGSKTSSTLSFLKAVNPEIILIPADIPNRFGFPHKKVLEHYDEIGVKSLITGKEGALSIKLKKSGMEVQGYRKVAGKYWN